jgi:Nitrogen permease regulator 2
MRTSLGVVLQYEWDITINWVSLHIDGTSNVRQISKKAEVDLEMVRACLRVLKHHGFVALVDMFCYSNRYECTEIVIGSKMLQEAAEYIIKRSGSTGSDTVGTSSDTALNASGTSSNPGRPDVSSPLGRSSEKDSSPVPYSLMSSFPLEMAIKGDSYSDRLGIGGGTSLSHSHRDTPLASLLKHEDIIEVKAAIVEFFAACHRGVTIGEFWISFISKRLHSFSGQVDWKKMFHRIDHRRLVIFGLLRGFIRRVHSFLLLRDRQSYIDYDDGDRCSVFASQERIKLGQHNVTKTDDQRLLSKAATLMDGLHCDDEIVSSIEVPFDDIFSMFPENSVVSVLSFD